MKFAAEFHGQRLVISAVVIRPSTGRWRSPIRQRRSPLVHRRAEFRAAPASVAKMHELVAAGRMRFIEGMAQSLRIEDAALTGVNVKDNAGVVHELPADRLLAFLAWLRSSDR